MTELTADDISELEVAGAKKVLPNVVKASAVLLSLVAVTYGAVSAFGLHM